MGITGPGSYTDIVAQGRIVFVCDGNGFLRAYDMQYPRDPLQVGFIRNPSAQYVAMFPYGNTVFLCDALQGQLAAIQITDPDVDVDFNPLSSIVVSQAGGPESVWTDGVFAYCGGCAPIGGPAGVFNTLIVVDITIPGAYKIVGQTSGNSSGNDLEEIRGGGNFLAYGGASGTGIVDIHDPTNPKVTATDPAVTRRPAIAGQHIYAVDSSNNLIDWTFGGFTCEAGEFGALRATQGDIEHLRGSRADFGGDVTARTLQAVQRALPGTGDPIAITDLGENQWGVFINTGSGVAAIFINNNGTIQKIVFS